jgi:hypothetical protein
MYWSSWTIPPISLEVGVFPSTNHAHSFAVVRWSSDNAYAPDPRCFRLPLAGYFPL